MGEILADYRHNLRIAGEWFESEIAGVADPVRSRQLRYSLLQKLVANWSEFLQRIVKAMTEDGIRDLGNCAPDAVTAAFRRDGLHGVLRHANDVDLRRISQLVQDRNSIAHDLDQAKPAPRPNDWFEQVFAALDRTSCGVVRWSEEYRRPA